jgi:hypothetical protein
MADLPDSLSAPVTMVLLQRLAALVAWLLAALVVLLLLVRSLSRARARRVTTRAALPSTPPRPSPIRRRDESELFARRTRRHLAKPSVWDALRRQRRSLGGMPSWTKGQTT